MCRENMKHANKYELVLKLKLIILNLKKNNKPNFIIESVDECPLPSFSAFDLQKLLVL
jgi:hypothetical protein